MTNKDIEIAVALSIGAEWRLDSKNVARLTFAPKWDCEKAYNLENKLLIMDITIPKYTENLTEIQNAIKKRDLTQEQKVNFLNALRKTVGKQKVSDFDLLMCDARQVCEAYLAAI